MSLTPTVTEEELNNLKVTELRAMLKSMGQSGIGKKSELISAILSASASSKSTQPSSSSSSSSSPNQDSTSSAHTILILDEALQCLPWESIPSLRNHNCSRVPGLAIFLSLILKRSPVIEEQVNDENVDININRGKNITMNSKTRHSEFTIPDISVKNCWYAIDIEGNLPTTRATMQNFISPYSDRWNWRGFVAEFPSDSTVKEYHDSSDLFIYCGHGAGERMCDTYSLRKHNCPASFLWGCSSGSLTVHGIHDPSGSALNYLLAGAPFVLGNLWDVTDKDIDRLSVSCLEHVFNSTDDNIKTNNSIVAQALSKARYTCKLKHAVGASPVIYGLPSRFK
jgi:separase